MKPANSQARLLHDLKKHVKSVNPGSEPFQSGLKSIEQTAWAMLLLRDIEWISLGKKTHYHFKVTTYVATPEGSRKSYSTPDAKPKVVEENARQRAIRKLAQRTVAQYARTCEWISERYEDALEADLNGRTRLRCLTGRAAFEALVKSRFKEIDGFMAGAKPATGQLSKFVERHGGVHIYRDNLYATEREADIAMREDSMAVPVDHDLIVDMFERAFVVGGFDENVFEELVAYMRSKDHKDALKSSLNDGADKGKLNRHDQIVLMVATAERKLASLSDPLPPAVYTKLGVSKNFYVTIMAGYPRSKDGVRRALRAKMYSLCPSKRPKPRRGVETVMRDDPAPSTLPPSMAPCSPGCKCIRHQEAR